MISESLNTVALYDFGFLTMGKADAIELQNY
jgi:hypothetical protein